MARAALSRPGGTWPLVSRSRTLERPTLVPNGLCGREEVDTGRHDDFLVVLARKGGVPK